MDANADTNANVNLNETNAIGKESVMSGKSNADAKKLANGGTERNDGPKIVPGSVIECENGPSSANQGGPQIFLEIQEHCNGTETLGGALKSICNPDASQSRLT